MKETLLALLGSVTFTASVLAHGGVELGKNGGRLLELSKNETTHGEVTVKDGKFVIELVDKAGKPIAIADQVLTATGGPSGKAAKLTVEKADGKFVVPTVKDGEWLILQFKENAKAKAVTARLQYDTSECEKCKAAEWVCKCPPEKDAKKK